MPLGTNHGGLKPGAQARVGPGGQRQRPRQAHPSRGAVRTAQASGCPPSPPTWLGSEARRARLGPRSPLPPAAPSSAPGVRQEPTWPPRKLSSEKRDLGEDCWGIQDKLCARRSARDPPCASSPHWRLPGSDWPGTRHVSLREPIAVAYLADADWLRPPGRPTASVRRRRRVDPARWVPPRGTGSDASSFTAPTSSGTGRGPALRPHPSSGPRAERRGGRSPPPTCDATLPREPAETRVARFQFVQVAQSRGSLTPAGCDCGQQDASSRGLAELDKWALIARPLQICPDD